MSKEHDEFLTNLDKFEKKLKEVQEEAFHLKVLCGLVGEGEFDPTFQMIISDVSDGMRALEMCRKSQ